MIKIQNNHFCLGISPIGAELDFLYVNDVNILWQKNALWGRQSPVLFPIIGSLKDGYYLYENQRYEMPVHGFVKDKSFVVEQSTSNVLRLVTKHTEETLQMYPFKFELSITYALIHKTLKVILEVKNIDDKPIYFSIGMHPGFSYYGLRDFFEEKFGLLFHPTSVPFVNFSPTFVSGLEEHQIKEQSFEELSKVLMEKRTLCYEGLNAIEIKSKNKSILIENDMSHLAFWQKNPENPEFICIEPWHGLPDFEDTDHDIEHKKNLTKLDVEQVFTTSFQISIL